MTAKTPEEMLTALSVEFPPSTHKTKIVQGKKLTYVDGPTIMRRLNAATNGEWNFEIISQDIRPFGTTLKKEERIILTARGRLTIPGLGSREHMGVQVVNAESGGEDLWKGAITDALKKAATLFGVGLELYGPDYESGEIENTPAPRPQRQQPTPITQQPRRPDRLNPQVNNPYTGPEIDIDESIKQDFLDAIASARTREEWTELLEAANSNEEPGIREAFWMILVSNAPTFAILKNIIGGAETRNSITRRVAEAARYRSIDAA